MSTERAVYIGLAPWTRIVQTVKSVVAASVVMDMTAAVNLAPSTRIVHHLKVVVTECVEMTVMGGVVPGAMIAALTWIVAMEFATIIVTTTAAQQLL